VEFGLKQKSREARTADAVADFTQSFHLRDDAKKSHGNAQCYDTTVCRDAGSDIFILS